MGYLYLFLLILAQIDCLLFLQGKICYYCTVVSAVLSRYHNELCMFGHCTGLVLAVLTGITLGIAMGMILLVTVHCARYRYEFNLRF